MKDKIQRSLGVPALKEEIEQTRSLLKAQVDESIYFANLAKNSAAVYIGSNMVLTKIYTGQLMYVDTRDISEAPHLMMSGLWEEEVSKIYQDLIESGDTVIDVGSTFGYFGVIAGTKLKKQEGAKIFMIDANPVYYDYMIKNLTVNGLIDFGVASTIALSGKTEKLELKILKDDWASSTFQTLEEFDKHREAPYEVEKIVKIDAMTLDNYADNHKITSADMIKLDIEGFEEDSYPGMKKLIKQSPNLKMLFEFTPGGYKKPKSLFASIQKDFEFVYCMPQGQAPVRVSSYDEMLKVANGDWIMLLLSKKDLSEKLS